MADWGKGLEGVFMWSLRRHRICWPTECAFKPCMVPGCIVGVDVAFCPFGAMATWAAVQASACCGCALQGIPLWGFAAYCSSKVLKISALAERNWVLLLALLSVSASSAFRRPRLGLHSGSRARSARSSSGGTPSRMLSARESVVTGLSV